MRVDELMFWVNWWGRTVKRRFQSAVRLVAGRGRAGREEKAPETGASSKELQFSREL